MRFVLAKGITQDMTLATTLYGANGELLMKAGNKLTEPLIRKIEQLGYNGLYIEDKLSQDLDIKLIVDEHIKRDVVQQVKKAFLSINKREEDNARSELKESVYSLAGEIIRKKHLMFNVIDIKTKQDYKYYHAVNVCILSLLVGVTMGLNRKDLFELGFAAITHDIGKELMKPQLSSNYDLLNPLQQEQYKKHPFIGYEYLKDKFDVPLKSYVAVLQHHERYDGKGYPNQLEGDKICLFARIISIADVYDTMTSDRDSAKAQSSSEVLEYLLANGGTQFDKDILSVFARKVAPFPTGTFVKLSDGRKALVTETNEHVCLRPKVRVVLDQNGKPAVPYELDLEQDYNLMNLTIEGIC